MASGQHAILCRRDLAQVILGNHSRSTFRVVPAMGIVKRCLSDAVAFPPRRRSKTMRVDRGRSWRDVGTQSMPRGTPPNPHQVGEGALKKSQRERAKPFRRR